mmetsp:Transcript_9165/g.22858  ORF Transcript_9165/g.22858 Transcript_9165/m.22858 type:complete len:208 (-) Transcript_9165:205-828(-)
MHSDHLLDIVAVPLEGLDLAGCVPLVDFVADALAHAWHAFILCDLFPILELVRECRQGWYCFLISGSLKPIAHFILQVRQLLQSRDERNILLARIHQRILVLFRLRLRRLRLRLLGLRRLLSLLPHLLFLLLAPLLFPRIIQFYHLSLRLLFLRRLILAAILLLLRGRRAKLLHQARERRVDVDLVGVGGAAGRFELLADDLGDRCF